MNNKSCFSSVAVILPSLNPDEKFNKVVDGLIEAGFEKIEEIMQEMSSGDVTLEDSFEKYKLGMEILKHCSDKIDKVEKRTNCVYYRFSSTLPLHYCRI